MKHLKKILVMLLCLLMVFTCAIPALAENGNAGEDETIVEMVENQTTTEDSASGDTSGEANASEETAPEEIASEETTSNEIATEDIASEKTVFSDLNNNNSNETTDAAEEPVTTDDETIVDAVVFDPDEVNALFNKIMACSTIEEMETVVIETENGEELLNYFTDEQNMALDAKIGELIEVDFDEEEYVPVGNYSHVAQFKDHILPVSVPFSRMLRSASADGETENGLILDKSVTANGNGGYTITLEAFTTGTVTAGTAKPSDIILVLDLSTSMENRFSNSSYKYTEVYTLYTGSRYYLADGARVSWCSECNSWAVNHTNGYYGWGANHSGQKYTPKTSADSAGTQFYTREQIGSMTRLDAMKQAATSFVDIVADETSDDRIAIVGFGEQAYYLTGDSAGAALLDATTSESELKSVISGIDNSDLESATEHGKGLEYAVNIFNAETDTDYTSRNKVVIVLTDGEPAPSGTNSWSSRTVKQAINNSYALKNNYSAAVYTISVMPGTDASNPTSDMDRYMDYMSSNYPSAQYNGNSIDDRNTNGDSYYSGNTSNIIAQITPGTRIDTSNGGFYLTADDIDTLSSIFGQIGAQVGSASIDLGSTTEIQDIVTPYFNMPENASAISVTTKDAVYTDGALSWTNGTYTGNLNTEIDATTNKITVTGFDFNTNFVAETGRVEGDISQSGNFHGRKLVLTFDISVKDGFLGGNGVPTNGVQSGIYSADGTLVEAFDVPNVDVAVPEITVTAENKDIYLLGDLTENDLLTGATSTSAGNNLFDSLDWQDDYVTITHTASNVMSDLTDDSQYTITTTIEPISTGTATKKSAFDTAVIHVYKPEITYKDSAINLGETADYETHNFVSVEWKHGETPANTAEMGEAPALSYNYVPNEDAFTTDTPVQVSVILEGTDVTSHVTFYRGACTFDGCDHTAKTTVTTSSSPWVNFVVHIKTFDLKITKTGTQSIDANQSYIFRVTGPDDFSMDVVIVGDGSVTIKGLPAGTYTVTELTEWSWRYTPEKNDIKVTTDSVKDGQAQVDFKNNRSGNQWLSEDIHVDNRFTVKSKAENN